MGGGVVVTFRYHCSLVLRRPRDFPIHFFHIDHNAPCLPPKVCITIVSNFPWVLQSSQEKSKTMVMQFCFWRGGVNKVHYENG